MPCGPEGDTVIAEWFCGVILELCAMFPNPPLMLWPSLKLPLLVGPGPRKSLRSISLSEERHVGLASSSSVVSSTLESRCEGPAPPPPATAAPAACCVKGAASSSSGVSGRR